MRQVGRWMVLEFSAHVDVFAIRGSATMLDFITDAELYFRVKTWHVANLVLPG